MILIKVDDRQFQANLGRISQLIKEPIRIFKVGGREIANQLKAHFRRKDREGKAKPRRQHLWLEIARTVQQPTVLPGKKGVRVSVNHPLLAHKVHGGRIVAKRVKALTIPLSDEAYGRTTDTFERETGKKLFLLRKGSTGQGFLAAAEGEGIKVHYLLRKCVDQKADQTALPAESKLRSAALNAMNRHFDRLVKKETQN